jgi:nucleoid-associated protein YgaU
VEVLSNGRVVASVEADGRGEFVSILFETMAGGAQELELAMRTLEGRLARSRAPVIVVRPPEEISTPIVAKPSDDGVELLQAPPQLKDQKISLDTVSYGEAGSVVLTGRAGVNAALRLYLDDGSVAEARADQDGSWRVELNEEVEPGVYTLRVDEVDETGRVTNRIESPFERENLDNIQLADGQVVVQPGNSLWRIARHAYGEGVQYTDIYDANRSKIRDPDLIFPGQIFDVPGAPETSEN